MKITKRHFLIILSFVLLWLCALGVATVYDLDISISIADSNSTYGKIFEVVGEPPAILLASFNLALMVSHFLKASPKGVREYIFAVLSCIGVAVTAFYAFNGVAGYMYDYGIMKGGSFPVILLTAICTATFIAITLKMKKHTVDKYFGTAGRVVLCAALTLVIIWAFKLTWGRIRFRQLEGDLSRFTPWYLPQWFTGFFSFPSGHTANATVIFCVSYYFNFLPDRLSRIKPILYALLGLWIAVVAFSRVAVGAHYLSDVLFGMAITFAIVYFSRPRNKQ